MSEGTTNSVNVVNDEVDSWENPRILLVGAGAIGGVSAGLIKQAGYNIEIITKYENLAHIIQNEGIKILGVRGQHQVQIPAFPSISEVSGFFDLVFMAVKATDLPEAIDAIMPKMQQNTAIITMENGICEDMVAEKVGSERTVGCVVGWGGTMHSLGTVEMTSTGEFVIGNLDNSVDPRLHKIREILSCVNPCYISENIYGSLYSKLIINSCITSLGAICGLYLGQMLANKLVRNIFIKIIREAIEVANAMSLKVEIYGGKLDYYQFLEGSSWIAHLKRHLMIRIIGFKFRKIKSSSLQSLERGKPTEIDFFNGYISEQGRKHQIATPINDLVVKQIKEIEQGTREMSMENFKEYAL